jgi:DNA-directed RNA polymerase subunit RPC12/RpoP
MKKDDLISRAAAIEAILGSFSAIRAIEELPSVDATPVVHARWVKVSGYATPGGDPVWRCSKCGKGVHVYGIEHGSYGAEIANGQWVSCPNCGAKMDGERRESK